MTISIVNETIKCWIGSLQLGEYFLLHIYRIRNRNHWVLVRGLKSELQKNANIKFILFSEWISFNCTENADICIDCDFTGTYSSLSCFGSSGEFICILILNIAGSYANWVSLEGTHLIQATDNHQLRSHETQSVIVNHEFIELTNAPQNSTRKSFPFSLKKRFRIFKSSLADC